MPQVRVLGLGNVLMTDDGFGPYVIEYLLARYDFADAVQVLDLGTPGLDLMPYVTDLDAIVFVDTVKSEGAPGELRCYRKPAILAHAPLPRLSPHDPGVKEALLNADLLGRGAPDVLLVGAIPYRVRMGAELTRPLLDAVPAAAEAIVRELDRLGVPPARRDRPSGVEPWWTRTPTPA